MLRLPRFRLLIPGAMVALALGVTTVAAGPPAPAVNPIDDTGGLPDAAAVNVLRDVSNDEVVVRLNRGDRQAHFNVILRGIEATDITNDFGGANGMEAPGNGVWGGCGDELTINLDEPGETAMAKFYTCSAHDSMRVHLSSPNIGPGSFPAIKIVFTEGVLGNVADGVLVGDDATTDWTNTWIPLYN